MTPAKLIRKAITDSGLLAGFGSFVSSMPDNPDKSVCFYDRGADKDGRSMRTGKVYEHPNFMIILRDPDYFTGHSAMQAIQNKLDTFKRVTVILDGKTYLLNSITRTTGFMHIGTDTETKKRRDEFSLNAKMTFHEVTAISDFNSTDFNTEDFT